MLLHTKIRDPRVTQVMITEVQSDPGLAHARVYVRSAATVDRDQMMTGLARSVGFLRRQLGRRLTMRHIPELRFVFDETLEQSERIHRLITESFRPGATRRSEP